MESGAAKLSGAEESRVKEVLEQYSEVFGEPSSLLPHMATDHRIELLPGSRPVSVRPYRYGHLQKDEIEKLVNDM